MTLARSSAQVLFALVIHHAVAQKFSSPDSMASAIKPMGLYDLNAGVTSRSSRVGEIGAPGIHFMDHAVGLSGRMQSSILWSFRSIANKKRFAWGDILAAEVFAGQLSSGLSHQTGSLWLAYKFEFGLGGRFVINKNNELGINLILLRFSRDNVSGNISGSGVTGRYRHRRVVLEAGAEARQDRVFGVAIDLQRKIPLQFSFTGRYLLKSGRNFGVSLETLPASFSQDTYTYSRIISLKVFYGIYF